MKIHIIGDSTGLPFLVGFGSSTVAPMILQDPRYMTYYHDECDGIIVTTPNAQMIVDRSRSKTTPLLAVGKGLLSCASTAGPAGPATIILRTGSRPQEWFSGAKKIERVLIATIDGAHAALHRLSLSGMTTQQHGAIYDMEDHPFLVGIGWLPEADDPIWLAFQDAVRSRL